MSGPVARAASQRGRLILVLGLCTLAATLACGAFFETDEGPDLLGQDTVIAGGLSLLLLAGTVTAFVRMARRGRVGGPAFAGLTVALCAYPVTTTLMSATVTVLNALGVYW